MKMIPLLLVLSVCLAVTVRGDLESGIAAYKAGDYVTARREFATAAEAKNPVGMHLLAALYLEGQGVKKDTARAIELFGSAAEKGYMPSRVNLGIIYHMGEGVPKDIEKALGHYLAAGKQGDMQATFNLGQIFRQGDGVKQDYSRAITYYRLAAQQGYVPAVHEYGLLHARGEGVEKNLVEAYGWVAFAANSGDDQAKKDLAKLKELLGGDLERKMAKGRADEIAAEIARIRKSGSPARSSDPRPAKPAPENSGCM